MGIEIRYIRLYSVDMRHNELILNENGQFVFRSKTKIGRYSQWFDNVDVLFKDVFQKSEFEFLPHKIIFLVPLFRKELFLVRTENKSSVVSEQFMYCSTPEKFKIQPFAKWLFSFVLNVGFHSVTLWSVGVLQFLHQDILSVAGLITPVLMYLALSQKNKFYLIQKVMMTEVVIWILLLSRFYCLTSV